MICQNCGSKNPNDSVFCVSCGAKIEKESSGNKKLFISLIIVSVLCVCAIVSTIILAVLYNNSLVANQSLNNEYQSLQEEHQNTLRDLNYYKTYYDNSLREKELNAEPGLLDRIFEAADNNPIYY